MAKNTALAAAAAFCLFTGTPPFAQQAPMSFFVTIARA